MSRIQVPPVSRNNETGNKEQKQGDSSSVVNSTRDEWLSQVRRVIPMILQFKNPGVVVVPPGGFFAQAMFFSTIPEIAVLTQKEWALVFSKVPDDNGTVSNVFADDIYIPADGSLTIVWKNTFAASHPTPENIFIMAYRRT